MTNHTDPSEPRLGPDQILPSSSYTTSSMDGATKIMLEERGPMSEKPISVYSFFKATAEKYPRYSALSQKINGSWVTWNYEQYFGECCIAAKSMIKLGLERFHGVCIMGFNSPEWIFANLGCIFAGGLAAGVYTTNSPESCRHLAENCQAQIIIVGNQAHLNTFLAVKRFLPQIKAIIQWSGKPVAAGVLSWEEFMAIGRRESDDVLQKRLSQQAINQCCTLIYTSGTTGPPKGVMCSQDHMTWSSKQFMKLINPKMCESVGVSYLPLCHSAGQLCDIYVPIANVGHVYFAEPDALKGSLVKTLIEVQPTVFFAVPRIWEKFYEKITAIAGQSGYLKRALGQWAKYHGFNRMEAIEHGRQLTFMESVKSSVSSSLFLSRIRHAIGLGRVECCFTGAAPLDYEVEKFFMSLGIPIMQVYGLSETISLGSIGTPVTGQFRAGSIGKIPSQIYAKTIAENEYKAGEGEICLSGRSMCMGYLRMPEKNRETIDDDNWLHTGDLGYIDKDNFLFITGRIKELVITSGGENIPPVLIETIIKKELPCVSNCILVGDQRKYLTMLLTLKTEVDSETAMPLYTLLPECIQWFQLHGLQATTSKEVIDDVINNAYGQVAQALQDGIDRYNGKAVSNAHKIQRWRILSLDFSLPTGELNNTLKIKRSFVLSKYSDVIDEMYGTFMASKL